MSTNDCYNYHRSLVQMSIDRESELVRQVCYYLDCPDKVDDVLKHFIYTDLVKKCLKAKKDENAPKKPRSSYIMFTNSIREEVTKSFPSLKMQDMSKKLSERWHDASEEVKEEFKQLAEKDRERYQIELEAYNKKLHEQDGSLTGVGSSNSTTQ